MGSNQKQTQNGQKVRFERNLKDRLAVLSGEGLEPREIEKDRFVKKWRADIRAIDARLKAIEASEQKTEGLARMKAEKAAAPREEVKEKKVKEAPAPVKEKQKKK